MKHSTNETGCEVDVWHVRLSSHANGSLLSADELARAERFRLDRDRKRFVACRSALREILGGDLGLSPGAVVFSYGSHGKPYIAESQIRFNVSHSGDDALIAVARGPEVGIDLERSDARLNAEQLAAGFLTPGERAFVENASSGKRLEAFLSCWTRKEAWAKAVGTGIAGDLARFDVSETLNVPILTFRDPKTGTHWTILDLELTGALIGALVVHGAEISVKHHEFGGSSP